MNENILTENSLLVFPNPAGDFIRILRNEDKPLTIELTDVSGRIVMQTITKGLMDLSNLQSGVYLLKVSDDRKVVTGKVIKE